MFSKKPAPTPERRPRISPDNARPNAVFSYHASRSARETNQLRDSAREQKQELSRNKPRAPWKNRLPNLAILLAIVVVAAFCLQLTSNAKIQTVGPSNSQFFLRDKSVYLKAAQNAFKPWANSNKLTVNTDKISADLRKQFPELEVVSVSLPIVGTQPTVYIQPAIPKVLLASKSGMFILDTNGRTLIAGSQVANLPDLGIPTVTDESGIAIQAGSIALPKDTVAFITQVVAQLKAKQVNITSMTLPSGTNELYVKPDKVGYTVKFNLHGDPREEAGVFLAVKQRLDSEHKTPSQYIDVRVENKAYYQ